jgi:hypothetical protein
MKNYFLLLMALLLSCNATEAKWMTIENGKQWKDNNGNIVQAHGGNFLRVGDTWYLVGEDRSHSWFPDVNMYSTKDFVNWKFEKKIIRNGVTSKELGSERMIERPKLMYCQKTGKFVVWCHWEAKDYSASEAAAFVCDKINGDYKLVWAGRPLGTKSRDCNIFMDDDSIAYFISTTNENQDLGLFQLSEDYLSVANETTLFEGKRREAPAIIKIDNTYYMISSACTGWEPNQAKIATSLSLKKGWSQLEDIGDNIAYDTQASAILKIKGTKGTVYVYVGDRWMDPDLPQSKMIMLPVEFQNKKMIFKYHEKWDLDIEKGIYKVH